jgi:hypothetical protein
MGSACMGECACVWHVCACVWCVCVCIYVWGYRRDSKTLKNKMMGVKTQIEVDLATNDLKTKLT